MIGLSRALVVLALIVIVFGAYVRLTDAGLGCPDWPGCYGRLLVPQQAGIHLEDPDWHFRPLEEGKAWREMAHRYLASTLGLGILILAGLTFAQRSGTAPTNLSRWPIYATVPLVMFQGLLGMWTVTLLLKPLVVSAHLLGGLATLSLLWWFQLGLSRPAPAAVRSDPLLVRWAQVTLVILLTQIFLGGWTSTNYAALACTDFPTCQGRWWPQTDFNEAFILWRGLGTNYEFGVLETPARTAIHLTHRIGAVLTTLALGALIFRAMRSANPHARPVAWCILAALVTQVALGITNVLAGLPLAVAVAHNGVAAILLLTLLSLLHLARRY